MVRRRVCRGFCPRIRWLRSQSTGEFARDARARERIAEALGADRHERGPHIEQVAGVGGALHPAHAHDGDRDSRRGGRHLGERNRADRGAGEAAGADAEPRMARSNAGQAPRRGQATGGALTAAPAVGRAPLRGGC